MTREDIIQLLREAGYPDYTFELASKAAWIQVERFAALVAAAEREACAKVCETFEMQGQELWDRTADPEAQGRSIGAGDCAAAIRARSET